MGQTKQETEAQKWNNMSRAARDAYQKKQEALIALKAALIAITSSGTLLQKQLTPYRRVETDAES
jgi:Fe-S cluster biosynthesis and repair protein YggX